MSNFLDDLGVIHTRLIRIVRTDLNITTATIITGSLYEDGCQVVIRTVNKSSIVSFTTKDILWTQSQKIDLLNLLDDIYEKNMYAPEAVKLFEQSIR